MSSILSQIQAILTARGLVNNDWHADMDTAGRRVREYRQYYDGEHDVHLSEPMKAMLRTDLGFSDNQCGLIIDTMVDRLKVNGFHSDDDAANDWAAELMAANRFDAMQIDIHEASLIDGDAYAIAEYDESTQKVLLSYEEAWDGYTGMMAVYDSRGRDIVAAVKVWDAVETTRVNVYLPDVTHKYLAQGEPEDGAGALVEMEGSPMPNPLGRLPVVHWKNRTSRRKKYRATEFLRGDFGTSELAPVIPLQDALNRTLTSMVMTAELGAFQIKAAPGFVPPSKLQPGDWLSYDVSEPGVTGSDYAAMLNAMKAYTLEVSPLTPFIEQCAYLLAEIGSITHTPLPGLLGADTASGESLKERKEGLYGKLQRAQTRFGNSWEDLLTMAAAVHNAYTVGPRIQDVTWDTQWKDVRPRDAQQTREHAKLMFEMGYEDEALRIMGRVLDYDAKKIEQLKEEKQANELIAMRNLGGNIPGFDQFNTAVLN